MVGALRIQSILVLPFSRHTVHIGIYVTIRSCMLVLRPAANFRSFAGLTDALEEEEKLK